MRKFVILAALLVVFESIAVPLSGIAEATICGEGGCPVAPKKSPLPAQHQSTDHTGAWAIGCGIASAGSLMIGTAIHAGDKNDPRQLTINEAAWHSAACPFLLPWALLVQATCPDNDATRDVARLAFRYLLRHPAADQSAFTTAYGEACRTGKLSRQTRTLLNSFI
jgi:hypothetical protein